ncbi:uncharacterized protein [Miscanthus floridulus]|uniref:uncharacterized protein isoform X2 n=1 Tax=Miscanthus floridulus TaxID=154761 RepID=UPI003458FE88
MARMRPVGGCLSARRAAAHLRQQAPAVRGSPAGGRAACHPPNRPLAGLTGTEMERSIWWYHVQSIAPASGFTSLVLCTVVRCNFPAVNIALSGTSGLGCLTESIKSTACMPFSSLVGVPLCQ